MTLRTFDDGPNIGPVDTPVTALAVEAHRLCRAVNGSVCNCACRFCTEEKGKTRNLAEEQQESMRGILETRCYAPIERHRFLLYRYGVWNVTRCFGK
jgi:hypothetical protein